MAWLTEPEKGAYDMQVMELKTKPDANCSNCTSGKHLAFNVYTCTRTPRGDADKTMQGNPCVKWRNW